MKKIHLMLVDDHEMIRSGLVTLLDSYPDLEVVAESDTGEGIVAKVRKSKPDIVIMDITMPGINGFEATEQLHTENPDVCILALTVHEDKEYFFKILQAGASGYLTKRAAPEELVSAIRTVSNGNIYLQPPLAKWLLNDYRRLAAVSPQISGGELGESLDVLSPREIEVLELVAEGFTSPEVGEKLGISPKTVSRHRERIMKKLNIHSCTELVRFAIRTGLIQA
jgi:two-component system response regulator NreC